MACPWERDTCSNGCQHAIHHGFTVLPEPINGVLQTAPALQTASYSTYPCGASAPTSSRFLTEM
eukprot:4862837-Pyramimonas_sp.AAC.2